jgi:hypothetical protein
MMSVSQIVDWVLLSVLMISTKRRITSGASYDIYLWAQAETQQG